MNATTNHIWLFSKKIDLTWLFIPVWLTWLFCFGVPENVLQQPIPLWFWAIFILGIDVTHVWSTIFRTYLDQEEFKQHKDLLIAVPFACFVGLFAIASFSEQFFWRVMAYIALHHFIKQQYGFLALYRARYGQKPRKKILSDSRAIYIGMLWPVIFWHLNQGRNFNWFVNGDFLEFGSMLESIGLTTQNIVVFNWVGNTLYFLVISIWLSNEISYCIKNGTRFPTGKVLWIITTAFNWFLGVIWFNSDFAFSLTNVVAHGVPYMVLIFFYVEKKKQLKKPRTVAIRLFPVIQMLLMIGVLAFGEEYFWDMFLNREKEVFFQAIFGYPFTVFENNYARGLALGLLSVPQVAHYFIDGFIWKKSKRNPYVSQVLSIGKPIITAKDTANS